jgi:hypothetical protein
MTISKEFPSTAPPCDMCGNSYDKAFVVTTSEGETFSFDSFECAIHKLAPRCQHCGCTIIGHGIEAPGAMFCCASCARIVGVEEVADRTDAEATFVVPTERS